MGYASYYASLITQNPYRRNLFSSALNLKIDSAPSEVVMMSKTLFLSRDKVLLGCSILLGVHLQNFLLVYGTDSHNILKIEIWKSQTIFAKKEKYLCKSQICNNFCKVILFLSKNARRDETLKGRIPKSLQSPSIETG